MARSYEEFARLEVVPKPGGGDRILTRLGPAAMRAYESVVAPAVAVIETSLGPNVMANRALGRGRVPWTALEPWRPARRSFGMATRRLVAGGEIVVVTDVSECYASIGSRALELAWRGAIGLEAPDLARLLGFLEVLHEAGVRGLPTGPAPSAILANAVLSTVDRALDDIGVRHLRWVDDIVIAAGDDREADRALGVVHDALADLGLRQNPTKTRATCPDDVDGLGRRASALGAAALG